MNRLSHRTNPETTSHFFTAAEFARALDCSPQNVRKILKNTPSNGLKRAGGLETAAWTLDALPQIFLGRLESAARRRGYRDVLAMLLDKVEPWQPTVPLSKRSPEEIDEAHKLRQVIRPILESGLRDLSRSLIEYAAIFGEPISLRHLKRLIERTANRAGFGGDLNRLELYMPERASIAVVQPAPPVAPSPGMIYVFADIEAAINRTNPANPAAENLNAIRELALKHYDRLIAEGMSSQAAGDRIRQLLREKAPWIVTSSDPARKCDAIRKQFARWLEKREARGSVTDARRENGRELGDLAKTLTGLGWFIPDAQEFYLASNRTKTSGSVPEAIRRTISQPKCPKEIREEILKRQNQGKPLVPESIARQIVCSAAVVMAYRNPTDAALRYANASGGLKFTRASGEYVPLRCGQRMIPDDGSINFLACVPWEFPTTTTSRKFGVLIGRFQLLLFVDALSYRICARSFVVRPKESYRTEDVLHLYNLFGQQYGLPDEIFHEGGVWNSDRVKDCLDRLNIRRQLVTSPHAKQPVENRFNKLWTVLSTIAPGQIGRYRGEMERENELLRSCRAGATDPRKVFPMFSECIRLIDQAIAEANSTIVNTDVGSWVPDELWKEQLEQKPLRKLEPEDAWKFAPCCEQRMVRNGIRVKFPLFEDLSVPFHFDAPWMYAYEGAKVAVYFDPFGDSSIGTVVLLQSWNGQAAGTVLGNATQTNDIANYARLMMSFGRGPDDSGRIIRQQKISAMRSNRKAIAPDGEGITIDEARDGLGGLSKLERGTIQGTRSTEEVDRDVEAEKSARQLRIKLQWEQIRAFERNNQELFI